jgi:hypothetical protein
MGGYGSGRRWSSKNTTSNYLRLDIRRLQRKECLEPGRILGWQWTLNDKSYANIRIHAQFDRIVLSYKRRSRSEDWQSKEYPVLLTQTPCHFGGVRQWFLCPARGCGDGWPFSMAGRYSLAGIAINSRMRANARNLTIVLLAAFRACMSGWEEPALSLMAFHLNQKECIARRTRSWPGDS